MSEIKFEEDQNEFGKVPEVKEGSDLTGKIIRWGFAKNRQQAQYVLVAVFVLVVIITIIVYRSA